jgi:HAD superfamily hydrolase (TIGR01549 family)
VPVTLFFDLDRTLCRPRVPFTEIFTNSCAPLLASRAVSFQLLMNAWAATLEEPGPSTMAGCLARALDACDIAASRHLIERCIQSLNAAWAEAQALDDGVADTLAHLTGLYPLGLITNGPSDGQRAVITTLRLDDTFRWRIVSGDADIGIRKPGRGIFQRALAMSGSLPEDTWYIGDSPVNDIAGAQGAGWRACWIAPADRDFPADLAAPDARIARLDELPLVISRYEQSHL